MMMKKRRDVALAVVLALVAIGCEGSVEGTGPTATVGPTIDPTPVAVGDDALSSPVGLGYVPLRRLTSYEVQRTVSHAFGVDVPATLLATYWPADIPIDEESPFDNNAPGQLAQVVGGTLGVQEKLADFSERAVDLLDDAALDALIPCAPSSPGDTACFNAFIDKMGPLLLRRPMNSSDHASFAPLLAEAITDNDFRSGARLLLRAMLLDIEFFYHIEGTLPTSAPRVKRLTDGELASRMAFLIWGRGPDSQLLDRVAAEGLSDPGVIRAEAIRLLVTRDAFDHIARIHGMWLGYQDAYLGDDTELAADLQQETDALLERVLFADEPQPWSSLFTATESYLTPRLAEHYGIDGVTSPGWVPLGDERRGLLSHGTYLSVGASLTLTSPTRRGNGVLRRLTCSPFTTPDVSLMAVMQVPAKSPGQCKEDWWNMQDADVQPECAGCHMQMDPIGFGLERFGPLGEYREVEPDAPACSIDGEGTLRGGGFVGPAQLSEVLVQQGLVQACFLEHYFEYIVGRRPRSGEDDAILATLEERFIENDDFLTLVVDLVSSEAFRHRVVEEAP